MGWHPNSFASHKYCGHPATDILRRVFFFVFDVVKTIEITCYCSSYLIPDAITKPY